MYIIIDLHGAPGAQVAQQPFTGQCKYDQMNSKPVLIFYTDAPSAGFYQTYQYQRAYNFLSWMIGLAHQNGNFRNVGMIEIVNEPIPNTSLINEYYPGALNAIRTVENNLRIPANNRVHIQMMVSQSVV